MANKNDNQAEDTGVDETTTEQGSETAEPVVELDRPTEITGELIENPTLEVEDVEPEAVATDSDSDESTDTEGTEEDDSEGVSGDTEDGQDGGQPKETAEEIVPEKDETGVYAPPAPDPGEFQPKGNYGFEVTATDGKTIKITNQAEADAFADRLDNEEGLISARQFLEFNRKVARMDSGIDRERENFETQKEAFETQQAQEKVRNEMVTNWSKEVNYLEAKGLVPKITPEQNASDWTDPANASEPAIAERLAIFKWMETENNDRRAAGIAEITSAVDAYRLMQADQTETQAKSEKKAERTARQTKGKMVSGTSSFIPDNQPAGRIVGEGGDLRDLEREFALGQ